MEPPEPPTISGILKCGSVIGLWVYRHCWLIHNNLYISKDSDFSHIKKQIKIDDDTKIILEDDKKTPQFVIITPEKKYVFSSILPEVLSWVFSLRNCKKKDKRFYNIDDFRIIKVLGRGFYGKVMLVEKLSTGEYFALKTIRKKKIMDVLPISTVLAEKTILSDLPPYPFIVNFCFSFQTEHKFYIGLEYAAGGELLHYLSKQECISIDTTRLYIAEIALAINHLHQNNIIYRDLKPENILLDAQGHIKLTNLGLSVKVEDDQLENTFCGTPEFLAPEILLQNGYSYPVDWWALGILLYFLIYKVTPFYDENQEEMFKNILTKDPEINPFGHKALNNLIIELLNKDPNQRLNFEQIKQHSFFHGLNWTNVENKEKNPSNFQPVNEADPQNFPSEFTNETPADSTVQSPNHASWNISGFSYGNPMEMNSN